MAKNRTYTDSFSIANGATTSGAVELGTNKILLGLVTPAALTGTAFTFQASIDGSNYYAVYDEGTSYSVNVGTSRYVALKRQVFDGFKYVKIVSGSSEGAARTIYAVSGE